MKSTTLNALLEVAQNAVSALEPGASIALRLGTRKKLRDVLDLVSDDAQNGSSEEPAFDGDTYDPALDKDRLKRQIGRTWNVMSKSEWRTLAEISGESGDPQPSVSARLRDLRKKMFGSYLLERRHRGNPTQGLYEYRLMAPDGREIPEAARGTAVVTVCSADEVEEAPFEMIEGEKWVEIMTCYGKKKGLVVQESATERHVEAGHTVWIQKRAGLDWTTTQGKPKTLFAD